MHDNIHSNSEKSKSWVCIQKPPNNKNVLVKGYPLMNSDFMINMNSKLVSLFIWCILLGLTSERISERLHVEY